MSILRGGNTIVPLFSISPILSKREAYAAFNNSLLSLSWVGRRQSGPTTWIKLLCGNENGGVITASPRHHTEGDSPSASQRLFHGCVSSVLGLRPDGRLHPRALLPASRLFAGVTRISPSSFVRSPYMNRTWPNWHSLTMIVSATTIRTS